MQRPLDSGKFSKSGRGDQTPRRSPFGVLVKASISLYQSPAIVGFAKLFLNPRLCAALF